MADKKLDDSILPEQNTGDGEMLADRRTVVKGIVAAGVGAAVALPTYLRDFGGPASALAQSGDPVKLGFIEDESGNLAVYVRNRPANPKPGLTLPVKLISR